MPDLLIRTATPADRGPARRLTLAAYEAYAEPHGDAWPEYRRNIEAALDDVAAAEQLVAERDGAIVGSVLLCPATTEPGAADGTSSPRPWPEVRLLAVAASARRTGVGSALVAACADRARRSGADRLALHTSAVMPAAQALYRRLGFVRAPELDFRPVPWLTVEGYCLAI